MKTPRRAPLPNRVDPFAALTSVQARGLLMGNRGGRIHRDDRTLGARRWASKAWICCRLSFSGRHRTVWGNSYTELFFLDEPTSLAAGHRPCFECRRADAQAFADAWAGAHGLSASPLAPEMDAVLHVERIDGRAQRTHARPIATLPDGAFIVLPGEPDVAFAVRGTKLLRWSHDGYRDARPRLDTGDVTVLTPPRILAVLAAGYSPMWHDSAKA
ncbi:MAG: hypothetical protein JWN71_615 [Xanthobacteraceae bacterium]|nr:hypothetical protein [Xanthobacteraceae bacterium]